MDIALRPEHLFKKAIVTKAMIQGNKLVTDTRVRVPNMFRATGATLSNISGKGSRALAFVDDQSRMRIALDSEELFRSAALVGGGPTMLMVKTQVERGGRSYPYKPEPAPLRWTSTVTGSTRSWSRRISSPDGSP